MSICIFYALFPERFGDGDTSQIRLDLDEVNMIQSTLKTNLETTDELFLTLI